MRCSWLALGVIGCDFGGPKQESCECAFEGHGVLLEDRCACLRAAPTSALAEPDQVFHVDPSVSQGGDGSADEPWQQLDWSALDSALEQGSVWVRFDAAGVLEDRLQVLRTSMSEHRLVLDGRGWVRRDGAWEVNDDASVRAIAPGVHTTFEDVPRSYVTVRGFEVTGSRDKGVYWRAGDHVVIEDLVIHDNRGTPAVSLDYTSRSGHRSESFVVRNNHIFDQTGECIYIGGAEGTGEPAHHHVEVVNNLVHNCRDPYDTRHDGINIKDQIASVVVQGNVVFDADWGIEAASPGTYAHNLVFDTRREGFQISDVWGDLDGFTLTDNVVIGAGHDGVHFSTERRAATGLRLERMTILDSRRAGVLLGANLGLDITLRDVVLAGNRVGLAGWGTPSVTVEGCAAAGNDELVDSLIEPPICSGVLVGERTHPAGPDDIFFTADDPWLVDGRGARLPSR